MQVLKVNSQRPALEFTEADGTTTRWEYEVILVKLEIERLEAKHELKDKQRTAQYYVDLADALLKMGIPQCPVDLAVRMDSVVRVQFNQLSQSIVQQVAEIKRDQS